MELSKPALAFLAGATFIGTVGIGKAAVDAAHTKVIPKGKDTDLSDSVRLMGSIFGITMMLIQLPKAWDEAQKLIQDGLAQ